MSIQSTIMDEHKKHPQASYEEILKVVKKKHPKCKTTAASVACTISRAKSAVSKTVGGDADAEVTDEVTTETDDEVRARLELRYGAMERMCNRIVDMTVPSLIVSGPPGMSKSFTMDMALKRSARLRHDGITNVGGGGIGRYRVDNVVEDEDEQDDDTGWIESPGYFDKISGTCTAVGLFHALWNMRNGGVVYLDDCDAVFRDEDALNILKVATDSTRERLISWRKNSAWLEEWGIDKTFEFKGHIVFLTNIDFERVIEKGHKDSEHFKALIDRARYLCLTLRTHRDFMIRIRMVCEGKDGMLMRTHKLTADQSNEILNFIDENQKRFYNLSIRLAEQLAVDMKNDPKGWKRDAEATKMRTY